MGSEPKNERKREDEEPAEGQRQRRKHFDPIVSLTQAECTCVFGIELSARHACFVSVVVGRASYLEWP